MVLAVKITGGLRKVEKVSAEGKSDHYRKSLEKETARQNGDGSPGSAKIPSPRDRQWNRITRTAQTGGSYKQNSIKPLHCPRPAGIRIDQWLHWSPV
ncbi:unnamed protein product, partial [Nesidiocoris tenuis]